MSKTVAIKTVLTVLTVAALMCGCLPRMDISSQDSGKPLVYASFYPMYDLASKACGELAEVKCLIPDGAEPHDWEPSPQAIIGLEQADLFVYSGADFEAWATSVISGLKNENIKTLETSAGLATLAGDPHIWLDPTLAKAQFNLICDALKEIDPENASGYEENRKRWNGEFDKLHEEYSDLKELENRKIIVAHEAFGYLCAAYGLEQIPISGYSPDYGPDPASMVKIIETARENDIHTVFYESASDPKVAQAVANEIGAGILPLSPLESLTSNERDNNADYFSIMRDNLAALKEALG